MHAEGPPTEPAGEDGAAPTPADQRVDRHGNPLSSYVGRLATPIAAIGGLIGMLGLALVSQAFRTVFGWELSDGVVRAIVDSINVSIWLTIGGLCLWLALSCLRTSLYLSQRRRYRFCVLTAWWMCAFFPFGTIIGLWTVFLLKREEVKAEFAKWSGVALLDVPECP